MPRLFRTRSEKKGLPPGSLVHIGEVKAADISISVLDYSATFVESKPSTPEGCKDYRTPDTTSWINIDGLHKVDELQTIGNAFNLHPLVMADIVNTDQRPKCEFYDDYIYLVLKMIRWNREENRIDSEQISLVIGEGWVLSFQERPGDVFDPVRDRIKQAKGKIRQRKSDYLGYALFDEIVDNYYVVLEGLGDTIEELEEEILNRPSQDSIEQLHALKREILFLRKAVWPLREMAQSLEREDHILISDVVRPYLRDVYDHTIHIIEIIDSYRDLLSGLLDLYMTTISNTMNNVMKVLTIIATIFIPITFVAGIYGMNFKYMPELEFEHGYFYALGLMGAITMVMIVYFHRKRWL